MRTFKEYIKLMITSRSGISSKRVCGVIGFLITIVILIYCTLCNIQAPDIVDTFIWSICALLGIDSITGPFYKRNTKEEE